MLASYERGYAVMNKELTAYSFQSPELNTCKRYCRKGDVIVERIPYKFGFSIRITWHKYWQKFFYFSTRYKEGNLFRLHLNWDAEYSHKIGKIIYRG